jgi:hypothetical protein
VKFIRRAGVIAFLDWIRRNHPGVRSLRSLSKDEFLNLATAFERSKSLLINKSHDVYRKWIWVVPDRRIEHVFSEGET